MIRTGPSSVVARPRCRTSCEPSHTPECDPAHVLQRVRRLRRALCVSAGGCASGRECGRCSLRAVDHHPGRRRRGVVGASRRPPRPRGPGRRRGEHERGRRPARLRSGDPGRSGRGRGRPHPLNPAAHCAGAPGRPRSPVRGLSSARGTGTSRGRASPGRRRGPRPPRRSCRPAGSPRPRTAAGRPARRRCRLNAYFSIRCAVGLLPLISRAHSSATALQVGVRHHRVDHAHPVRVLGGVRARRGRRSRGRTSGRPAGPGRPSRSRRRSCRRRRRSA